MSKKRALRQLIITVGFLPGLWLAIGVDPEAQITYIIIDVIAKYISSLAITTFKVNEISSFGDFVYAGIGAVSAVGSWVSVIQLSGLWGFLAVAAAFAGGLLINTDFGIWLFISAWIIGLFLPLDED